MTLYRQDELFATISGGADARVFIDWEAPLLDAAVEHLCRGWTGGLLDLGALLVVVPTRHAGRRLREALAVHAAGRGEAVVPPVTVPPEFLVQPAAAGGADGDGGLQPASPLQSLLAWINALQSADLDKCRHVFPVDPVERGFSWALQTALQLERLRSALGENGLTIAAAVKRFGKVLDEAQRWKELAALERRMGGVLRKGGRVDRHVARARAAGEPSLPEGVESVVVLATPDPGELALRALEKLRERVPIEVVVYAPRELRHLFDGWGRPLPMAWAEREIPIPDPFGTIHLAAHPRAQAGVVMDLLLQAGEGGAAGSGARVGAGVGVAVPDPEVAAHLDGVLRARGIPVYNPDGMPFSRHALASTLRLLGDLLRTRSFRVFNALAHDAEFLRAVAHRAAGDGDQRWSAKEALANLDRLRDEHLPDTLDDLIDLTRRSAMVDPHTARMIRTAADWLDAFQRAGSAGFGNCLLEWLAFLYGHREFHSDAADDVALAAIAGEISLCLEELEGSAAAAARLRLAPADALEVVLHVLSGLALYREREAGALELQGWLELLWEDAPQLIVTACNDGLIPETIVGDPFLPNKARVLLGVRDNQRRFGRDAYLLSSLLASRAGSGRVDLIVGRARNNGDPLRPSRLLFQCPDEALAERAMQLFHEMAPDSGTPAPPWQRAWKLRPPRLPEQASIRSHVSVTALGAYLSCPFRFFLAHGLGMREVEADKQEMNPMEFGNLCHHALEQLGRDESLRDCADEREVRGFLLNEADRFVESRYGKVLTVPVRIQLETARQRLSWAAGVFARDRAEGWRTEHIEWRFDRDHPWEIGGLRVRGTIDRVDRHGDSGALRVLDYKTANKATLPVDAHLVALKRTEDAHALRQWLLYPAPDGRMMRWIGLQLPLYVLALRRIEGDGPPVTAGYFNLPRAAGETGIALWNGLSDAVLEQAMHCAEAAATAIVAEAFWPPAARPRFDDFARLFFASAGESFEEPADSIA